MSLCAIRQVPSGASGLRGAHFRDDYPEKSAEWAKYNLKITKGSDGKPKIERMPVCPLTDEMKKCIEEQSK